MTDRPRVLFVDTGKAGLSRMAAALCGQLAKDSVVAESAEIEPSGGPHPMVVQAMRSLGIDLTDPCSQPFGEVRDKVFDVLVTIGETARMKVVTVTLPGKPRRIHWDIADPAGLSDVAQTQTVYAELLGSMRSRVGELLETAERVTAPSRASRRPGIATAFISMEDQFKPALHLPQVAAAGFAAVELTLLGSQKRFDYTSADAVAELDNVADDLGIVIWSIHEQNIPECLGAADAAERDAAADEVRRCLELAHRLGAKAIPSHLLMNPAFDTDAAEEAEMEKRIVERLHALAPEVRASGARIAFENTGRRPWASPPAVARRMATLPANAYGFVLDTGHANLMGDFDTIAHLLGPRLITLHLNDNHAVPGNDEHLPPGKGTFGWSKVRELLETTGYEGCILYEIDGRDRPDQALLDTMTAHRWLFELGGN
jgi:sugar phosphate isomerase/epimerase/protein-tyrosine-phosphatase